MEKTGSPRTTLTLACWSRFYDDLLAGLAHDLAGRASALHSLALVGRRGPPSDDFVLDELEVETKKLARLGEAVRVLAEASGETREGSGDVDVEALAGQVVEVLCLHHDFDGDELRMEVEASAPRAGAPAAELMRTLVLLAADVASRGAGLIRVLAESDPPASTVTIELSVVDPHTDAGQGEGPVRNPQVDGGRPPDAVVLNERDAAQLIAAVESWSTIVRTDAGWTVELMRIDRPS